MYRHAITTPVGDRIKLRISFDAEKMLAEYKRLQSVDFEYYDVIPLRTTAHQVDTSLPFPPPAKDCADGCYTDWLHTNALRQSDYHQYS